MPLFGVSIYSISRCIMSKEITPEEGVSWLCENGAQAIEIVPFGIDILADKDLAKRMKAAADAHGVPISNYSLNADFTVESKAELDNEIARVKAHMEAATVLGIKTFRSDCTGFRRPIEENTIEAFLQELPIITESYEILAEYAAGLGVKLLLENHGFHANGAERVRLILQGIKSKNFGHQLDVGNYICMDDKPEITVKKMLPYADVIHMKDFYIRQRDPGDATQFECSGAWFRSVGGQYLRGSIMGQGDLDIPNIIHTIKSSGFNGNLYIEYEGMEDPYYGTRVSLDNLKRIWSEA